MLVSNNHPSRVDIFQSGDKFLLIKFVHRQGGDIPLSEPKELRGFEVVVALSWMEQNGYDVACWPGGARAWKGVRWPIRTKGQVFKKREQVRQQAERGYFTDKWGDIGQSVLNLDFAYAM